jgi:hypothetical protein
MVFPTDCIDSAAGGGYRKLWLFGDGSGEMSDCFEVVGFPDDIFPAVEILLDMPLLGSLVSMLQHWPVSTKPS